MTHQNFYLKLHCTFVEINTIVRRVLIHCSFLGWGGGMGGQLRCCIVDPWRLVLVWSHRWSCSFLWIIINEVKLKMEKNAFQVAMLNDDIKLFFFCINENLDSRLVTITFYVQRGPKSKPLIKLSINLTKKPLMRLDFSSNLNVKKQ